MVRVAGSVAGLYHFGPFQACKARVCVTLQSATVGRDYGSTLTLCSVAARSCRGGQEKMSAGLFLSAQKFFNF